MVKRESKVLLVVVFLLGCFASHVARTNFDVPPANAQTTSPQPTPTQAPAQRWEHACEVIDDIDQAVPRLNQYGAAGYELVTWNIAGGIHHVCLKRPLSS